MNALYNRIRELANENGKSLAQVERDLDLSNGIISTWKKREASSDKIKAVAKYFGVSSDYLLGISDKRNIEDSDDADSFFRMYTDGLTKDEIADIKKQLKFAEEVALKNLKKG